MEFFFKSKFSVLYLMIGSIIILVALFIGSFMHKSWEYTVVSYTVEKSQAWQDSLQEKLNAKGLEGWELVDVNTVSEENDELLITTYFKRVKK